MNKKMRWWLGGLVLIAVAIGLFFRFVPLAPKSGSVTVPPNDAQQFVQERGMTGMKQKYFLPLVAVYQKMLVQYPDNLDLKKKLAFAHFGAEQYDQALPLLEEVATTHVVDAEVFYELGFIQSRRGEQEQAVENLSRALVLNPQHEAALKLQGELK